MAGKENRNSPSFTEEVMHRLGGETITLCYQCGTCASSCPVARTTAKFNPRKIIKSSLMGERDEIISGDAIWLCCSCYNCQERCPQKVEIADVIYALRNIAFKEGYIPSLYSEFASAVLSSGRTVPLSKFMENKRPQIGLPPLKPAGVEALKRIFAATGFDSLQKKREESS